MAGNTLLVKHAGIVPQCAIAFEKLLTEAGAPVGLYTNLLISHDQSDRVVDDPRIKGVALTGSVAAGRSCLLYTSIACIVDEEHPVSSCVGDWVLIHVGFAMSRIDETEAAETLKILTELGEAQAELEAIHLSAAAQQGGYAI